MQRADELVQRYRVNSGVPTFVVNGKYITDVAWPAARRNCWRWSAISRRKSTSTRAARVFRVAESMTDPTPWVKGGWRPLATASSPSSLPSWCSN